MHLISGCAHTMWMKFQLTAAHLLVQASETHCMRVESEADALKVKIQLEESGEWIDLAGQNCSVSYIP